MMLNAKSKGSFLVNFLFFGDFCGVFVFFFSTLNVSINFYFTTRQWLVLNISLDLFVDVVSAYH